MGFHLAHATHNEVCYNLIPSIKFVVPSNLITGHDLHSYAFRKLPYSFQLTSIS